MELLTEKADFAVEYIDLPEAVGQDGVTWEPFQLRFFNNDSRFGIDNKARQIAWSFTAAADAVIDGILNPDTPHIFVSVNLDESMEKIRYAKAIVAAIDKPARPEIVQESRTSLGFANGSRIISHPCRPPRGKARARIYLDEMAHYKSGLDREIYTAALPATIKGDGYIRVGSSPIGASGMFWELFTESTRRYPGYDGHRFRVPWWHVRAFCHDPRAAALVAPQMETEERVRKLGTKAIIEIFENLFLEDFQQEYECDWVDEASAWISWDIIKRNQSERLLWWHAKTPEDSVALIPEIQRAIQERKIERVLVGGIDVGRKKDLTEFMALGRGHNGLPLRLSVSLDRVPFDEQFGCLWQLVTGLPFAVVLCDETGLGMQLAENLARSGRVAGVSFTNEVKELFAVEARIQAERGKVPLPLDRDIAYQIHSIKKTITAAKFSRFDTAGNERHHADKFWAWAMAIYASAALETANQMQEEVMTLPRARIV